MKYHTVNPSELSCFQGTIGRFFGRLSPPLFRQALSLRNTIASLDAAQTGSWGDILSADDASPWLIAHLWLLDSWGEPTAIEHVEKSLTPALFFLYAAIWLHEAALDEDMMFDASYATLEESLHEEARRLMGQLLPISSGFWQDYKTIMKRYQEAILWRHEWRLASDITYIDWQCYANRLTAHKIGITAAAHLTDRADALPALWQMIDLASQAAQIRQDILALRRDLLRGHLNYPLMQTIKLAGLATTRPFNVEQIMGAAVLTGSIKKVCAEAVERLEQSRRIASELAFSGWATCCQQIETSLADIQRLFSLKGGESQVKTLKFLPYRDTSSQTIRMAAGYLLADPSFSESAEINRGGLEGLDEATGIIFPFSFITYLLLENGHPLGDHVDGIFQKMESLEYRYYENMAVAPDADETAILLRLFKYSSNQELHRRQLERPLQWLVDNLLPDGRIPAFWHQVDAPLLARMVVWENYCLTAEVNTLLGLIAYDWPGYCSLIERSAAGVFGRYLESDFGTTAYYGVLYSLWQLLTLTEQIQAKTADAWLRKLANAAYKNLSERLAVEASRGNYTPQEAAFLILACLDGRNDALLNSNWVSFLQKTQRHDGSWDNEPFYVTCDRDGLPANWYSSRTMTTAFCYHALNQYAHRSNQS